MFSFLLLLALAIALLGAYAVGYSPKALWDAAVAKIKAWKENWKN